MKKLISFFTAVGILMPYTVAYAYDGELMEFSSDSLEVMTESGDDVGYGETLHALLSGDETSVLWQRTDGENVTDITESEKYVVTEEDMGYSIIATTGDVVSEAYFVDSYYKNVDGTEKSFATNTTISATRRYSDTARTFTLKNSDKNFVLAETFNNEESKYFIVADDIYGTFSYKYDSSISAEVTKDGITQTVYQTPVWDPQKVNETAENRHSFFAYWINSTEEDGFLAENNTDGIPDKMKEYINFGHIWRTEGTPNWATCTTPSQPWESYTFKAGVTIPSYSEILHYTSVGFSTEDIDTDVAKANRKIWSRTPVDTNKNASSVGDRYKWALNFYVGYNSSETDVRTNHVATSGNFYVRPVFYLKDGFFADVAVDLETAGADVIEEIKKQNPDKLSQIYTAEEMVEILGIENIDGYVYIEDIKISVKGDGQPQYGKTLISEFTYGDNNKYPMADYTVKWYSGDTLVSDSKEEYIVTEADAGKAITFKISVTDTEGNQATGESGSVSIPSLYNDPVKPNYVKSGIAESKPEHVFTTGGKEFTLVESFDNSKSTYYVVANDTYGKYKMTTLNMDVDDSTSVINWLNNTFVQEGNKDEMLPDGIREYIDYDHIWLCEASTESRTGKDEYSFKAGIVLPSVSEFVRYNTILGFGETNSGFWTRTVPNWSNSSKPDVDYLFIISGTLDAGSIKVSHWDIPSETFVRPEFYLNEDFFGNVKIDIETAGEYVLTQMKNRYKVEDLTHMYDEEVLERLGFNYEYELGVEYSHDGENASSLAGISKLNADITLKSNTEKSVSGLLVFALYDEELYTKAISFKRISADGESEKTITMTLSGLNDITDGANAKVMLWNNAIDMGAMDAYHSFK